MSYTLEKEHDLHQQWEREQQQADEFVESLEPEQFEQLFLIAYNNIPDGVRMKMLWAKMEDPAANPHVRRAMWELRDKLPKRAVKDGQGPRRVARFLAEGQNEERTAS